MTLSNVAKILGLVIGGAGLLIGCAQPADIAHPVEAKLGWFTHVEGADLRSRCSDGSERYRLIYNEDYWTHTRSHEIDGATGTVRTVVRRPANLAEVAVSPEDPLAPFRAGTAQVSLTADALAGLTAAIRDDLAERPPEGLRVRSDEVWWLMAGCRGGKFVFDLITPTDGRWTGLHFPAVLAAQVPGTPLPGDLPPPHLPPTRMEDQRHFTLTVGPDGLRPMPKLM